MSNSPPKKSLGGLAEQFCFVRVSRRLVPAQYHFRVSPLVREHQEISWKAQRTTGPALVRRLSVLFVKAVTPAPAMGYGTLQRPREKNLPGASSCPPNHHLPEFRIRWWLKRVDEPTSKTVPAFLGRVIRTTGAKPRHLVSDQGPQFSCDEFKSWCRRKDIRPRFGAIGEHGSIAVIERLILTLKQSIAWLTLVPLRRKAFQRELTKLASRYNHSSHYPFALCA